MTKWEKLADLIGMSVNDVKNEIDEGMIDILIELNSKGYTTIFCCEGHCNPEPDNKGKVEYWNGYLGFDKTYNFVEYPPRFNKVTKHRRFFHWEGYGEESRSKYLSEVLEWARCLPTREKDKIVCYHLFARNKKTPNGNDKELIYTYDYEEIKCLLKRADMENYFNFHLVEDIQYI